MQAHALSMFGKREAFVCGRALSKEYKPFGGNSSVDALKCQQCDTGQPTTAQEEREQALGSAVKRARRI